MATFSPAPDVAQVAKQLIAVHHTHLWNTRLEYVFREKATESGGKAKWGSARKVTGLNAMLATPGAADSGGTAFFVVEIAKDVWDQITPAQREALVDHELCHCAIDTDDDGDEHLTMKGHDMEEFAGIVSRHGLWRDDIGQFLKGVGARQLTLFADSIAEPDLVGAVP